MGSPDLDLADGLEEERFGAAPHAGEVLLQAAEALRGVEELSGWRLWNDSRCWCAAKRTMTRVTSADDK
jgi:hypothetical protein